MEDKHDVGRSRQLTEAMSGNQMKVRRKGSTMLDKEEAEMKEEEEKKSRPVVRLGMLELGKLVESLLVARWFRPEKKARRHQLM